MIVSPSTIFMTKPVSCVVPVGMHLLYKIPSGVVVGFSEFAAGDISVCVKVDVGLIVIVLIESVLLPF